MVGETRRRGAALDQALLDAAWDELAEVGYGRFTLDGVAARAATSRPVLARRWPNRADLAMAAVRHHGAAHPVELPDTGSTRDDLLALLRAAAKTRAAIGALFSLHMSEYYAETGTTPAQLRESMIDERSGPWKVEKIFERGVERGELDPDRITPRIVNLPTDLLRHELLMTMREPSDETLVEIVDTIVLPLVTA